MNLSLVAVTKSLAKSPFDCGYPQLNNYLRRYAGKNDRLSIGKTFLALTDDDHQIVGYFTVSTAQIAVNHCFQSTGVGRPLLTQAFHKAVKVSQNAAVFAVLLDAIDEKATAFYLKYGFIPFEEHPLTPVLPLTTIKEAMQ